MTDLTRLTAVETAAAIAAREVSAVEVAQAHLDRIAAVDGTVHAFLHVAADAALASAALVDAALDAGTPPASPLAGVPLALKDVFTMGSSTEYSAYGPTRNPWDVRHIPGGSGGGSAASLAAYEAPLAIGTDTGGSIRQPAAGSGAGGGE